MTETNEVFYEILQKGPSQSTVYLVLKNLREEGRLNEVVQQCLKALMTYPQDTRLHRLLAETYQQMGLIGQAESELKRVAEDIHELIPVYKLQAEILHRQSRSDEAAEALRKYLVYYPHDPEALDLLKNLEPPVAEKPVEESASANEMPEGQDPSSALATPTLAELYHDQGQTRAAVRTYEKVLARNPDDEKSRQRLAELKAAAPLAAKDSDESRDAGGEEQERVLAVLEGWLGRIQEMKGA
jgi:tetratricopeptide (TPR) repeat protein